MSSSDEESSPPVYRSIQYLPTPLVSRQSSGSSQLLVDADHKLAIHEDKTQQHAAFGDTAPALVAGLNARFLAEDGSDRRPPHITSGEAACSAGPHKGPGGSEEGSPTALHAASLSRNPTLQNPETHDVSAVPFAPPSLQPASLFGSGGADGAAARGEWSRSAFDASDVGLFVAAHAGQAPVRRPTPNGSGRHSRSGSSGGHSRSGSSGGTMTTHHNHGGAGGQSRGGSRSRAGAAELSAGEGAASMTTEEEIDELAHQWASLRIQNHELRESMAAASRSIEALAGTNSTIADIFASTVQGGSGSGGSGSEGGGGGGAAAVAAGSASAGVEAAEPSAGGRPCWLGGGSAIVVDAGDEEDEEEGEDEEDSLADTSMREALAHDAANEPEPVVYRSLGDMVDTHAFAEDRHADTAAATDAVPLDVDDAVVEDEPVLYRCLSAFGAAATSEKSTAGGGGDPKPCYRNVALPAGALLAADDDDDEAAEDSAAAERASSRGCSPRRSPGAQDAATVPAAKLAPPLEAQPGKRSRSFASELLAEPLHPSKQASVPASRASPTAEQQRIAQLRELIATEKAEKEALLAALRQNEARLSELRALNVRLRAEMEKISQAQRHRH